jgi:hypothetical protein
MDCDDERGQHISSPKTKGPDAQMRAEPYLVSIPIIASGKEIAGQLILYSRLIK